MSAMTRAYRGHQWLIIFGRDHDLDVNRLDPATFDIAFYDRCALAQAAGGQHFYDVLRNVRGCLDVQWAIDHGFLHGEYGDAHALNSAWMQLIQLHEQQRVAVSILES